MLLNEHLEWVARRRQELVEPIWKSTCESLFVLATIHRE